MGTTLVGNASGWNCSGQFLNTGYVAVNNTQLGNGVTGFTHYYKDTNVVGEPKPIGGRQGLYLLNGSSVYGAVTLQGCPLFQAAPDTAIYGDVIATSLNIYTAPFHAPSMAFTGAIGTVAAAAAITITMPVISSAAVA